METFVELFYIMEKRRNFAITILTSIATSSGTISNIKLMQENINKKESHISVTLLFLVIRLGSEYSFLLV